MNTTPEKRSFSSIGRIIHYFVMWGLDYGFIFGFAAGSMALPLIGTIIGTFLGIFIGGLYGLIVGLGMSATYKDIEPETDLDAYGQQLVRRTAKSLTALNLVVLPVVMFSIHQSFVAPDPYFYRVYGDTHIKNFLAAVSVLSVLLSFVVSATARHFPHWMIHGRQLNAPMSHAFVMRHEMETAFRQIKDRSKQRWLWPLVLGAATLLFLISPAGQYPRPTDWINALVLGVPLTFIGVWVGRIYLSLVNAAVLTFIKRVLLRDYFPNLTGARYRARVTFMAFVATWAASWWTFFFAPFIALLMAYFVYHTVALPDEMQEKSKRKEASMSQAPSTLRLEEGAQDGELVDIDLSHLADPASVEQHA